MSEANRAPTADDRPLVADIGRMVVGRSPQKLAAILGSCVGLALFDPATGVGALAHIMLPLAPAGDPRPARYASSAVPALVDAVARAGGHADSLRAKMAGGASMIFGAHGGALGNLGARTLEVVRRELQRRDIPLAGEDVGGSYGRRMTVHLDGFRVRVSFLRRHGGEP